MADRYAAASPRVSSSAAIPADKRTYFCPVVSHGSTDM